MGLCLLFSFSGFSCLDFMQVGDHSVAGILTETLKTNVFLAAITTSLLSPSMCQAPDQTHVLITALGGHALLVPR